MNFMKFFGFLAIGKTQESTEATTGFKRYVGVGSTFVLAVNPTKAKLDELRGFESANAPEYTFEENGVKGARITFVVKTDSTVCNDISMVNTFNFILRNAPAKNSAGTKVRVIDVYGNYAWATEEDAKAGKKLLSSAGNPLKIADKYRIAYDGEVELVSFLKKYLGVKDAFNYVNGTWVLKEDAADYIFGLEHIKDYFTGNVKELEEALKLQPNNKIKLLYGVRTADDGKQYQTIAMGDDFFLPNYAGTTAYEKMATRLAEAKNNGKWASTEFKVQELAEYSVNATSFESPVANDDPFATNAGSEDLPWS